MKVTPVILSGGSGTRLWPVSRHDYPKQFAPVLNGRSLFQVTLTRLSGLELMANPWVVCNEAHRFISMQQALEAGVTIDSLLVEPVPRDTAAAIAVAALALSARDPEAVMFVAPSDHAITNPVALYSTISAAVAAACEGSLITFGIAPEGPATGYGYIRYHPDAAGGPLFAVERFVEKPDLETATRFVEDGGYLWNSGMFMFGANAFLGELETHAPDVLSAARAALEGANRDLDFVRLDKTSFEAAPKLSVDYAVMEKTKRAMVARLEDSGWTDLGDWAAFDSHLFGDKRNDPWRGKGSHVFSEDAADNFVWSDDARVVGLAGVSGLAVVSTRDALLVADRRNTQDVKQLVAQIEAVVPEVCQISPRVYRPWGWYEGLVAAGRFQVKRLRVWPGQALSLQMHHHRSEHWVVVEGTAKVTIDDAVELLSENQSTYIPIGATHRLANPGKVDLTVIEVQVGPYLGEDDIVRLGDAYARS